MHLPGQRIQAKDRSSFRNQSWLSYLSPHEQRILENPNIEVMTSDIPEDNVNGMKRHEMFELSEVSYTDHLNTQMFRRDNRPNSFSFYQNLFFYKYTKAFNKEKLQNPKTCPDHMS